MPRVAKPKIYVPQDAYVKSCIGRGVFAKVVDGKLLCCNRVITNTKEGIDSWQEFSSVESAAKSLGVSPPERFGCPIIDKDNPRIDWSTFRGGYYIPKS